MIGVIVIKLPLTSWHYSGFGNSTKTSFGNTDNSQTQDNFKIKPNAQIRCSGCYGYTTKVLTQKKI